VSKAESEVTGLAAVLQRRGYEQGVSGGRRLRLRSGTELSEKAAQGVIARHSPVPCGTGVWDPGGISAPGTTGRAYVSLRCSQSESRMLEMGTSGLMSGDGKRGGAFGVSTRAHPRLYSPCSGTLWRNPVCKLLTWRD